MRLIVYTFLFVILGNIVLEAQSIKYNQEFSVSPFNYINDPYVTSLLDSGFVVVWSKSAQEIYGQIYNKDKTKRGEEFKINTTDMYDQYNPNVCTLVNGDFVVGWSGDGDSRIYLQIFNNLGEKKGEEFHLTADNNSDQHLPQIGYLLDGGFVVCWQTQSIDSLGNHDININGQMFNSDGILQGSKFRVNSHTYSDQDRPSLCILPDGGFVMCWESLAQNGIYYGIWGKIFNSDGSIRKDEFLVSIDSRGYEPNITSINDGGFVVCWHGSSLNDNGNYFEIYYQIFDSKGSRRGLVQRANTNIEYDQKYPNVSMLPDSGFVICWGTENLDGSLWNIYCQVFDKDGIKQGPEFKVNTFSEYLDYKPNMTFLMDGKFIVFWNRWYSDYRYNKIHGKYYEKEITHILAPFSLLEPVNDMTLFSLSASLNWQKPSTIRINLPWEIEYRIYVYEDESLSLPIVIDAIYDTTYTIRNLTPGKTYFWKVLAKNIAGDSLWSSEINAFFVDWDATTSINEILLNQPKEFKLQQNYPNPFNPKTIINYELPITNFVKLAVFDINGREVATLVNEQQSAGMYSITFNAQNLASGVYFYHIQMGSYHETRKMLLLR